MCYVVCAHSGCSKLMYSFYTCYQILLNQFCSMGMKWLGLTFWDDTKYTKRLSVSPASLEPRHFWPCEKGVQTRSRLIITSMIQPRLYQKPLIAYRHHCATTVIDACSHKSEHLSDYATPTLARRGLKPCYDTFFQLAATFLAVTY